MKLRGAFDVADTLITGSLRVSSSVQSEITGALILSGAAGNELRVIGMTEFTGSVIMSGSSQTELRVVGDMDVSGSLFISGAAATELMVMGNTTISGSGTAVALAISGSPINAGTLAVAGNIVATEITGSIRDTKTLLGFVDTGQSVSAQAGVSGLTLSVSVGAVYEIFGQLAVNCPAVTAAFGLQWPTGISFIGGMWQVQTAAVGSANATSTVAVNFANANSLIVSQLSVTLPATAGSTTGITIRVTGIADCSTLTASTVLAIGVRAQGTANSAVTIKRGSYLRLVKIR